LPLFHDYFDGNIRDPEDESAVTLMA
jgi:hypothetical protein